MTGYISLQFNLTSKVHVVFICYIEIIKRISPAVKVTEINNSGEVTSLTLYHELIMLNHLNQL